MDCQSSQEQVKKPLKIKAVPYYGCLLTRPENNFDSPENPKSLDDLILSLGAEPVKYYYKTKCCGGPILLTDEDLALTLAKELLVMAKETGADCIVVTCPMCHLQLDAKQKAVESKLISGSTCRLFISRSLWDLPWVLTRRNWGFPGILFPLIN